MTDTITVHIPPVLPRHYDIVIGNGLLSTFHTLLPEDLKGYAFVIVTDENVETLYGLPLQESLGLHVRTVGLIMVPAGEENKSDLSKIAIESALLAKNMGRDTCIIALGGGVIGDLAGFVAATYMRGIPYIQVPTTLLAMIDSSIGGKTAIDTPEGKNLIGAFWQPRLVVADIDCLKTLPKEHLINGWIEALKIFLTCDAKAFEQATTTGKPSLELTKKAIKLKANIVSQDPEEKNIRAILNFGHTIGHAIEKASNYKILHGHAVGYGILVESHISLQRALLTPNDYIKIVFSLEALGIKGSTLKEYKPDIILSLTRNDKKALNKAVRYILLNGIGKTYHTEGEHTHPVTDSEVISAWKYVVEGGLNAGE